jgi:hypothetical protein
VWLEFVGGMVRDLYEPAPEIDPVPASVWRAAFRDLFDHVCLFDTFPLRPSSYLTSAVPAEMHLAIDRACGYAEEG